MDHFPIKNKKKINMKASTLCLAISFACLVTGVFIGKTFSVDDFTNLIREVRTPDNSFSFINPLLECTTITSIPQKKIVDLRSKVHNAIDQAKKDGDVSHVSLYFRDLNNGPWFGVDESVPFIPASLLKLPFMIALYKQSENDPLFFQKKVKYGDERVNLVQYFKPNKTLTANTDYTVEELLKRMIIYSDNDAASLLTKTADLDVSSEVYRDIGVIRPQDENYELSTKDYATFFRILFNSTYLERKDSEAALKLLSQADFIPGIRAGVPNMITVAVKFGERNPNDSSDKQLHDCGVVYYPERPYLLCIMTRGEDYDAMVKVIARLSKIVYEGVNEAY